MDNLPYVIGLCLTADRPEYTQRAIRLWQEQSYPPSRRKLLIWDTGQQPLFSSSVQEDGAVIYVRASDGLRAADRRPIGAMRNDALEQATHGNPVIAHWDSDDWYHKNRLIEQVYHLHATGVEGVGYRETLAYRTPEAWRYTNANHRFALCSSLVYWRNAWEGSRGFPPVSRGEGRIWFQRLNRTATLSAIGRPTWTCQPVAVPPNHTDSDQFAIARYTPGPVTFSENEGDEPRMIVEVHGGNTSTQILTHDAAGEAFSEWQRRPDWDERLAQILKGARVALTKDEWITLYGGAELLEREGFTVVPCVDCDDSICHGWRVVKREVA